MAETTLKNPVVRGSCTPDACGANRCGAACCRVRTYSDAETFTESWCPYLDLVLRRCTIYETRPEGCRRYPDVLSLTAFPRYENCGYYLAEDDV